MDIKMKGQKLTHAQMQDQTPWQRRDWYVLLLCLGLGVLAEVSFFHGEIGISYPIFVAAFYTVLFLRFRLAFHHRRIGLLLMLAIWVMAGSFVVYDLNVLHLLNCLVLPAMVFVHIVLITSPGKLQWASFEFINVLKRKMTAGVRYSLAGCSNLIKYAMPKSLSDKTSFVMKRVFLGLVIGFPLLFVTTVLLMSADAAFEEMMLRLPLFIEDLNVTEGILRTLLVLGFTFVFFGVFQVLPKPVKAERDQHRASGARTWDGVTALTILAMLNVIYLLFVIVQFQYFFSSGLQDGLTYAEYARRGFFELVVVTLINWTLLFLNLNFVQTAAKSMQRALQVMYALLIGSSGVMLASAFSRLGMYEEAYGFTVARFLAHAFMIFLMVIFAYTLIRVWLPKLTLLHFYIITGLVFYTALNVINIEQVVVDQNLKRYEESGKIDTDYFLSLSYTGVNGLMDLYEMDPSRPDVQQILRDRQQQLALVQDDPWQSFNFTKAKVKKRLAALELPQ